MAGGQTRRDELAGKKQRKSLEDALVEAGGHTAPPEVLDMPATPEK